MTIKIKKIEDGFHIIEVSALIVMLLVVGFVGWRVISQGHKSKSVAGRSTSSKSEIQQAKGSIHSIQQESSTTTKDVSEISQASNE